MKKYVCPLYNTQQYKDVLEILGSKTRLDALYISKGMRLPTVQEAREDVKRYVDIDKESTSTRLESMLQDKSDSYTRVSRRIESLKSKLRRNTSKDRKLDRKKLLDLEKRQFEIRSEIDNLNKAK